MLDEEASRPFIRRALVAALDITLDDDECARLEEPYVPHPVLGHR